MSVKSKSKNQKGSLAKKCLFAAAVGVLLFFLCMLLCSAVITKNDVSVSGLRPAVYISVFLACFASGFAGAFSKLPFKGIVTGLFLGSIVAVLLFSVMFIINGAELKIANSLLILAMGFGGIPGGILGANLKQ